MKETTEKMGSKASSKQQGKVAPEEAVHEPLEEVTRVASTIHEKGQTLFDDAGEFLSSANDGLEMVQNQAARYAKERPYVLFGAAMGVGFVLGGGLTFRITKTVVNIGGRLLLSAMAREVASRAGLA